MTNTNGLKLKSSPKDLEKTAQAATTFADFSTPVWMGIAATSPTENLTKKFVLAVNKGIWDRQCRLSVMYLDAKRHPN